MDLERLEQEVMRMRTEYERVLKSQAIEEERLVKARQNRADAEQAQKIVQEVASAVQRSAHQKVASVVTRCLQAVFDDPYEFEINFERKRGKTEATMLLARRGMKIRPMEAVGGSVIDIAAFALRLANLVLAKPPKRRVLILDEPFRFVSPKLRPRVRKLLETLAEEMGIQFILVTHDSALAAGKVIELK